MGRIDNRPLMEANKNDDSADQDKSWLLGTGGLAPTNHRCY